MGGCFFRRWPGGGGGAEAMLLVVEIVVVVGCFEASAAPLHLGFDQNIPNPL
jgi:hypothetical protein